MKPHPQNPECENFNELKVLLRPDDSREKFVGLAQSVLRVCLKEGYSDVEEYVEVRGQKVD